MARDPNTPLILWICAAVCAHYVFAEGGGVVAQIHEDRSFIAFLGRNVRERVRAEEQTFEVTLAEAVKEIPEPEPPPPPPPPKPTAQKPPPPPPPAKKPEPPKAPEAKKSEPLPKMVLRKEEPKPQDLVPQLNDKRIAVRQHVKPEQQDNHSARFIGDQANHVEKETVATQTSHDRDDPNPTPGGNHAGPQERVGDSARTRIAESDEHEGEKNRAPGERGTEFEVQKDPTPLKNPQQVAVQGPKAPEPVKSGGDGKGAQAPTPTTAPQLAPGGASPPSPEVEVNPGGGWSFNPVRPGAGQGAAPEAGVGQSRQKPDAHPGNTTWLGLGGTPGPGQVNLNLSQTGVVAAVGADQLRKEREADGERRRSEHRGSWTASNFERWRSAIENYVSSVKAGNQTALNTAAVPFATYLNGMHNRIHPIFADNFLGSLDGLPKNHPMNDPKMFTRLEIVVTKDGRLVKMGIIKTSGMTAFDIAALDSVNRAQPFGPAPGAIVSSDGNVYLHWEFHRDEVYACSTMNARPYLLANPPRQNEPAPPAPGTPKSPSQERGLPPPANIHETREGMLLRAPSDLGG